MPSSHPGLFEHPKTGVFWIRRRIPSSLVATYGRRMMQETLGTKDPRLAEALYLERMGEIGRTWQAYIASQSGGLSRKTIAALAGEFYRTIVTSHEDEPGTPQRWLDAIDELNRRNRPVPQRVGASAPTRVGVSFGAIVTSETMQFIQDRGFNYRAENVQPLLRAFFEAKILAYRTLARRATGDYSPEPDATRFPVFVPPRGGPAPVQPRARLTVAEDFAKFAEERVLSAGTQKRWRPLLLALAAFIRDDNLALATPTQIVAWTRALAEPDASGRRLTSLTISDAYLAAARSFFSWARGAQMIPSNPCDGIKIKVPRASQDADEDKGFSDSQADLILSETLRPSDPRASIYLAAARRWIPWVCAYTGARVNEITQLRREDVRKEVIAGETIWVIRITPEAGTVKGNLKRDVPLHPHLVEQGFVSFVTTSKDGPLFYNPKRPRGGSSANPPYRKMGDKLAAWVRELGIADDVAPNHGWRHRFNTSAQVVRMWPETRARITGHAAKSVGEKYGSHLLQVKYREICLLPAYQVDPPVGPRAATKASRRRNDARKETVKRAATRREALVSATRPETEVADGSQKTKKPIILASVSLTDEQDLRRNEIDFVQNEDDTPNFFRKLRPRLAAE